MVANKKRESVAREVEVRARLDALRAMGVEIDAETKAAVREGIRSRRAAQNAKL